MKIIGEYLNGLVLLEPDIHIDHRGSFMETYRSGEFTHLGLPESIVQENVSVSKKNVIRGLHFQWDKPQGKLIRVISGSAKFVELDIRKGSPSFSQHWSGVLSADNQRVLWVPPGFANGFCALKDDTQVEYKCTAVWNPNGESAIRYNDPELNIDWNIKDPILSEKDLEAGTLSDWMSRPESDVL